MDWGKFHVLIVDDEPSVASLIRETLRLQGFQCRVASDAESARRMLVEADFRIDVLITDIRMPGGGGMELLAHVKRSAPGCKVILVTGNSTRQYVSQALQLGAYDYLEKPFGPARLVEIVTRAVSGQPDSPLLVDRAAEALELTSMARDALLESVRALVLAVEAKDPYTRRHSEQVAHYAVNLARALNLTPSAVEQIRVAALLHDVGKIAVPDHVLTKPSRLTDQEFGFIRNHPVVGAQILGSITFLRDEAVIVRHHHERWDGGGYPDGLTGEETPFAARIICVADCMDAMLMARVYKSGYSAPQMLGELAAGAGSQFDPRLASVATQWCRQNPDQVILSQGDAPVPGRASRPNPTFARPLTPMGAIAAVEPGRLGGTVWLNPTRGLENAG
ncbi:MAG: Cyclic di-GMP phosphodiesterase response regulator RpfG [Phycisphaerae bacterium]|nr:Cyclic di-GMP phosphodiesterase response regulator RpfG [Phycisphaerae bacterium]